MSLIGGEILEHIASLSDDELLWLLASSRELRGRVEHEIFTRLDERDSKVLEGVGITGKSGTGTVEVRMSRADYDRVRDGAEFDVEGHTQVRQSWISLSIDDDETLEIKQSAREAAARVIGGA